MSFSNPPNAIPHPGERPGGYSLEHLDGGFIPHWRPSKLMRKTLKREKAARESK